jgi:transposase
VTVADEAPAIAVEVIPGQANDAPRMAPMVDAPVARVPVIDEGVGDKGFDSDAIREDLIDRGIGPVIPNKKNRVDPWPLDPGAYRERNRVERLFGKVKQFRRVATRYQNLQVTFLGMIHLALGFIRLRRLRASRNVNTT